MRRVLSTRATRLNAPAWRAFCEKAGKGKLRDRLQTGAASAQQSLRSHMQKLERMQKVDIVLDKRAKLFLVIGGGVIGAVGVVAGMVIYVNRHPETLEKIVTTVAVEAFSKALTFEAKKLIFFKLPEPPQLPASAFQAQLVSALADQEATRGAEEHSTHQEHALLQGWGSLVERALNTIASSWLLNTKLEMRRTLMEEVDAMESLEDRLICIQELHTPSAERNIQVADQLDQAGEWVDAGILEQSMPQEPAEVCEPMSKVLVAAISFFPGPINQLVRCLDSSRTPEDTAEALVGHAEPKEQLSQVLAQLQRKFSLLHPEMQQFVLQAGVSGAITNLRSPILEGLWPAGQVETPYSLYKQAIDRDLVGPLRRDARISEHVLGMVKAVFLALPAGIQARILLRAIQHPCADGTASSSDQAQMVKDLMESGGVVSVKLAQMIAEDPRVPKEYRQMLGDLRESNTPMSRSAFWASIPAQVRGEMKQLGTCLGTGSVKQVHKVRFMPDSRISTQECAVAVLRKHVEDEAMASLAALQSAEELAPVARKLGRLVYGEFNLFEEGEALQEFGLTSIGRHKDFRVVKVHHHSPKCLIEEIADGPTVAKVLKGVTAASAQANPGVQNTLSLLTEYHHAVFDAFVHDGIIHSDIHLGNAVQGVVRDGRTGFTLFDVGQFERIGPADTKAILWTLSWVTTSLEGGLNLRHVALSSLVSASTLEDQAPGVSDKDTKRLLEDRISEAFEEAISPNEDGELPDKKTAYMLLLRNAEAKHVSLPKGAFAVAKMIDGIISQQASYALPQVLDEAITAFLKSNMTWAETLSLAQSSLTGHGSIKKPKADTA